MSCILNGRVILVFRAIADHRIAWSSRDLGSLVVVYSSQLGRCVHLCEISPNQFGVIPGMLVRDAMIRSAE